MRTPIKTREVAEFPVKLIPHKLDATEDKYVSGDRGFSVVRVDNMKIISNVSSEYLLIRHREVLDLIEKALQFHNLEGSLADIYLYGHEHSSMAARYMIDFEVEKHKPFVEIRNSYDKSAAVSVRLGIYTLVCLNGLLGFKTWNVRRKHQGNGWEWETGVFKSVAEYINVEFPKAMSNILAFLTLEVGIAELYDRPDLEKFFLVPRDHEKFLNSHVVINNFGRYGNNLFSVLQSLTEFASHYETHLDKSLQYQERALSFVTKWAKEF